MPSRRDAAAAALERAEAVARPRGGPVPDPQRQEREPDPHDIARAIVLKQLSMAPRSRAQLEDKLRARNCADDVAQRVLDRMSEVGLVDDKAFAEMLVRSKRASRGLAKRALAQELRTKGIDDELVKGTLGSLDDESERALAEAVVARKLPSMSGLDPRVQARRLSGMLARKGYSSSVAYAVVTAAVANAPEHQRD
jgi:regulatory protein